MSYGKIFNWEKEDDLGIVTFDLATEATNVWSPEAIDEFCAIIDALEKSRDTKGVVFISGKPDNFHSGGDLKLLNRMKDKEETTEALKIFHNAFNRLSALKFPTVAAIDGHCLGGGLEFALACTARIAKASKTTLLGLPECNLGLFPGGGGTQRLPRLIGYGAIELILRGKVLPASEAFKLGIVDKLVSYEDDLLGESTAFLNRIISGHDVLIRKEQDFSQIDEIAQMAHKEILKVTRGRELPGPTLALKSIQEGLKVSLDEGIEIEMNYFVEAVLSKEAKGSIHTFFLKTMSDKPRKMMTRGFEPRPISRVAVLGFGAMGRGIIVDLLRNTQISVITKDVPDAIEPGKGFVTKILEGLAEKKKLKEPVEDAMSRLTALPEYTDDYKEVDLVIEAVFEDIKIKSQVYQEICEVVSPDCLIASNTSSIPLQAMSKHVTHPERFAGAHFFSPVWLMQLVEIIRGEKTSQSTIDNLLNFADMIRKRPIICKDNPGFVVNAVLFPYFMDSLHFLELGNSIEKVDGAFMQFGMPVGPIRLIDEVGIDVAYYVVKGKGLEQSTLKNLITSKRYGFKKSGKGFFLEDGRVDPDVIPLISKKEKQEMSSEEMQTKVLTEMLNIGKDLIDKAIVDDPRMIDIGMIWGTGFPADKGGPMKWADLIGLSQKLFGKTFYESS
jgi:3-hydroxyacyl-CoA dehydrogenase/enoyl-CoA hydratase/carnithine racemase